MSKQARHYFDPELDSYIPELDVTFGSVVTVQRSGGWVARKGAESIFRAFDILLPEVRKHASKTISWPISFTSRRRLIFMTANITFVQIPRMSLKNRLSESGFNKTLQSSSHGFECARTRQKSLSRFPRHLQGQLTLGCTPQSMHDLFTQVRGVLALRKSPMAGSERLGGSGAAAARCCHSNLEYR